MNGFKVNELWQIGEVRMHEVRQGGFKIHKVARESDKGHKPWLITPSEVAFEFINNILGQSVDMVNLPQN